MCYLKPVKYEGTLTWLFCLKWSFLLGKKNKKNELGFTIFRHRFKKIIYKLSQANRELKGLSSYCCYFISSDRKKKRRPSWPGVIIIEMTDYIKMVNYSCAGYFLSLKKDRHSSAATFICLYWLIRFSLCFYAAKNNKQKLALDDVDVHNL